MTMSVTGTSSHAACTCSVILLAVVTGIVFSPTMVTAYGVSPGTTCWYRLKMSCTLSSVAAVASGISTRLTRMSLPAFMVVLRAGSYGT